MNGERFDIGDLSPTELRAYAAGYLEAIRDRDAERDRLAKALEASERDLAAETRAADIFYHDAYCSCRKRLARSIIASAGVIAHRTNRGGTLGL